jgi:hypothetical protein
VSSNIYTVYSGTTFEAAPTDPGDVIYDGSNFIMPTVDSNHPPELFPVKLRDAVRIDVYQQAMGGSGSLKTMNFISNGYLDRWLLPVIPESTNSILVWLNGNLLKYGPTHDYVVNFDTGMLVFVLPPVAGNLIAVVFSIGGIGTSVSAAYVVESGVGYQTGDAITLAGPANPSPIISVDSVCASNIQIITGGIGYRINDVLVLTSGIAIPDNTSNVSILVNNVDTNGSITNSSIQNRGQYITTSGVNDWLTSGSGSGANVNIEWGVFSTSVITPGFYLYQPSNSNSIIQSSTTGLGDGAIFGITFDNLIETIDHLSDGFATEYALPPLGFAPSSDQVYVTLNGHVTTPASVNPTSITLSTAPLRNTVITITVLSKPNFSVVLQDTFTILHNVWVYQLTNNPSSTLSPYLSTIVLKNGRQLRPPSTNIYVGDSNTSIFNVNYMPTNTSYLSVYVNNIKLTLGVDYTLTINAIVFNTPPTTGSSIDIVATDPAYGFEYSYDFTTYPINIIFEDISQSGWNDLGWDSSFGWDYSTNVISDGDSINIITFTEDVPWYFETELFTGNSTGTYQLTKQPSSAQAMIVTNNSVLQQQGKDFSVIWQNTPVPTAIIQFVTESGVVGNKILVTYATGSEHVPAVAWRLLIGDQSTSSWSLSNNVKTQLLSNVYINSDNLIIADSTMISMPSSTNPGSLWINNELIEFWTIRSLSILGYPNAALVSDLMRARSGTSAATSDLWVATYQNGDGISFIYPMPSGAAAIAEAIYVNNFKLEENYSFVIDPIGYLPGRYVQFVYAPNVGVKNIKIVQLMSTTSITTPVHQIGATIYDGGGNNQIPNGGYQWQPNWRGTFYQTSPQVKFLLSHSNE